MQHVRKFVISCLFASIMLPGMAFAEDPPVTPLATGIVSSGVAEAQVTEAVRHGEILTIKVRFKGLKDNLNGQGLYSSLDKSSLEKSFYILVGNKNTCCLPIAIMSHWPLPTCHSAQAQAFPMSPPGLAASPRLHLM